MTLWSRRSVLAGLAATGCAPLGRFPFDRTMTGGGPLEVQFFSVGCFLVRFGGVALLTDPFFSHLSLGQVLFGPVRSDPAQVDPYLGKLRDVRAVVVGHSHYDHALDLPYVSDHLAPDARIFGSRSLANQVASSGVSRPVVPVDELAASETSLGEAQLAGEGRLRILAVASGHPDNVPGIHLFTRRVHEPVGQAPSKVHHWQEGETLAYLVDWLEGDRVAARIYVQTSSRGLPDGLFPTELRDEAPVDVALLAMDCANAEARGDESIIDFLSPATVVFCHWGDFFRRKDRVPYETVKIDLPALKRKLVSTPERTYLFPAWDSVFHLPLAGGQSG